MQFTVFDIYAYVYVCVYVDVSVYISISIFSHKYLSRMIYFISSVCTKLYLYKYQFVFAHDCAHVLYSSKCYCLYISFVFCLLPLICIKCFCVLYLYCLQA